MCAAADRQKERQRDGENRDVEFENFSQHLITSLTLVVEMCANSLIIRREHVAFLLAWVFFYVVFVWVVVGTGAVVRWPYFFFEVESAASFVW